MKMHQKCTKHARTPFLTFYRSYTTLYKAATNAKATVVEVRVLSALLNCGLFELKVQPFQDSVSTCYIFQVGDRSKLGEGKTEAKQ